MPTLKNLLKPTQNLAVQIGSETVNVVYRPSYLTPEFEDAIKGLNEESKATEAFLTLFSKLVVSWDLKQNDDDEQPIEVSIDGLKPIPYEILGQILTAVQEAILPNEPTAQN